MFTPVGCGSNVLPQARKLPMPNWRHCKSWTIPVLTSIPAFCIPPPNHARMCMGAIYMSGVRTLNFAARDPFAGSINMLGTTWYLERKSIKVFGPDQELEMVIVALFVEHELRCHAGKLPEGIFWEMYGECISGMDCLGTAFVRAGRVERDRKGRLTARYVFEHLVQLVR